MADSWFEIDPVSSGDAYPTPESSGGGPEWAARATWWAKRLVVPALLLAVFVIRPDQFWVEQVEFRGNLRSTDTELRQLVGVRNGVTLWGVDPGAAAEGAMRHPWVRSASSWRRWPDTLVVQVEEYRPVALVERNGLHYADEAGTLFLPVQGQDLDHPIITGVQTTLGELHPDIPRLIVRDALALLSMLDTQGLATRDQVSSIDFSSVRGFTVQLRSGARVVFDLERYEQQVARLQELTQRGVDLRSRVFIDLAPESLAIVRPLDISAGDG